MRNRAEPSGITLSAADAALAKGMLLRGDRQHDIAAWFGVNGGRIGEIATDYRFGEVELAPLNPQRHANARSLKRGQSGGVRQGRTALRSGCRERWFHSAPGNPNVR